MLLLWITFAVLIAFCGASLGSNDCNNNWKKFSGTGFYYKKFCDPGYFFNAEHNCQKLKGHLVSIHSEEENEFVHNLVKSGSNDSNVLRDTWIGFTRVNDFNAWGWTDSSAVDFKKWSPAGPGDNTTDKRCTQMTVDPATIISSALDSYWQDDSCLAKKRYYVCKKKCTKPMGLSKKSKKP